MNYKTLVTTGILQQHLNDPNWIIIDSRYDLMDTDAGNRGYIEDHIPGAIHAHLDQDLSGPKTPETGRHPLPDASDFIQKLSGWGIDKTKQVVIYDTTGGSFAARLWCMLNALGHSSTAVLDGGLPKWIQENRPTRNGSEHQSPSIIDYQPWGNWFIETEEVEMIRNNKDFCLIDARSPERYRGEEEPIDPVAGRIPGAVNRFHGDNLAEDGTFLPASQLREEFITLLNGVQPKNTVVYCGSGVTSCHHILAMEIGGLRGAKLYAGSWSEWIRNVNRPRSFG